MNTISKKKPQYPVNDSLKSFLDEYGRSKDLPVSYNDLASYRETMPLCDSEGKDTLWETLFYDQNDIPELNKGLTFIYALLKTDGNVSVIEHLRVDRIDYCPFGNSQPFRVRIINNFNDNYDYFYVKKTDASRIYGMELEHLLSPNRIHYLVDGSTLIEEHIAGVPGDQFMGSFMKSTHIRLNETRLAKEFVKFNERSFIRLLGDMRSYNYVVDITPDFDDIQYRIRAVDFDQQCYEGRKSMYLPQYFKENNPIVDLCIKKITPESLLQYQKEERAFMAKRIKVIRYRTKDLLDVMAKDTISTPDKVKELGESLARYYENSKFLRAKTMGQLVRRSLFENLKDHI